MKNYNFKIPVADILQESSTHDNIQFVEKFSTLLPQLIDPGISADIDLQGMDKSSLLITIKNAQACCSSLCDICWKNTKYTIYIENKYIKCFFEKKYKDILNDEEVLYIDPSRKVVNLENFLVQSFLLADDIVHMCTDCEKQKETISDENDDFNKSYNKIIWK